MGSETGCSGGKLRCQTLGGRKKGGAGTSNGVNKKTASLESHMNEFWGDVANKVELRRR